MVAESAADVFVSGFDVCLADPSWFVFSQSCGGSHTGSVLLDVMPAASGGLSLPKTQTETIGESCQFSFAEASGQVWGWRLGQTHLAQKLLRARISPQQLFGLLCVGEGARAS